MERALSTFIPEVSLRENILVGVCKVLSDSVCDACIVVVFLFCSGVRAHRNYNVVRRLIL